MSRDDGMDGTDWKARAIQAGYRIGVLTAALEAERIRNAEVETIWDRDARALVYSLTARRFLASQDQNESVQW